MNKRIKKKVTKRALDKYYAGEKLTHKEYKVVGTYVFANEFDFQEFSNAMGKVAINFSNEIANVFESLSRLFRVKEEIEDEDE